MLCKFRYTEWFVQKQPERVQIALDVRSRRSEGDPDFPDDVRGRVFAAEGGCPSTSGPRRVKEKQKE
jgi:hypothetical protein